jgi:hypothetical protein
MTFPSAPKGLPARLGLLSLVSALFTHPAVAEITHPTASALALALQRGHGGSGGGSGASSAVLVAIIGLVGTIFAAVIMRRGKN